jgi:hypothetical protein
MSARGCTSENAFSLNPDAISQIDTAALEAFYVCPEGGTEALFALATDYVLGIHLPNLPPAPSGTTLVRDPPIGEEELRSAAESGSPFVLVLHVSIEYFKTSVCDGLHRC